MHARSNEDTTYHVAFDCGNSSFRIMLGTFTKQRFTVEILDQIPNNMLDVDGYLYWDIGTIFNGLKTGLKKAYAKTGHIDTVGVTTWGIDFGLLDGAGKLVANPLCYRNTLGVECLAELSAEELTFNWENSGIQNHPMNSLYQLLGIRKHLGSYLAQADRMAFIPDLIIYLFTDSIGSERSIASTSQMYNVMSDSYSSEMLEHYGLSESFLPPMVRHGSAVGWLREELQVELGVDRCPFICTPSHDTASAVTAVPTLEDHPLFISSGTWSLIGVELDEPMVSPTVEKYKFANEAGVFSTTTFLKNSTGLYLLQEVKKNLEAKGIDLSWGRIAEIAKDKGIDVPLFNPNHQEIFSTRDVYGTLSAMLGTDDYHTILASCYVSLGLYYDRVINDIVKITGMKFKTVYVIGGGCRDRYLNQLTADLTGLRVHTGPVEAASIGNLSVQRCFLEKDLTLGEIRKIVIDSTLEEQETYHADPLNAVALRCKKLQFDALFEI